MTPRPRRVNYEQCSVWLLSLPSISWMVWIPLLCIVYNNSYNSSLVELSLTTTHICCYMLLPCMILYVHIINHYISLSFIIIHPKHCGIPCSPQRRLQMDSSKVPRSPAPWDRSRWRRCERREPRPTRPGNPRSPRPAERWGDRCWVDDLSGWVDYVYTIVDRRSIS